MIWCGDPEVLRAHGARGKTFSHPQGNAIALFPFTTHILQNPDVPVGYFFQVACGKTLDSAVSDGELIDAIVSRIADLDSRHKDAITDVIREVVASARGSESASLRLSLGTQADKDEKKIAQYIASIPCDRKSLLLISSNALNEIERDSNLVERMVYEVVGLDDLDEEDKTYFLPNRALSGLFLEDLELVLSEPKLERTYLEDLLDFYFYMSILQSCMTLNDFCNGKRYGISRLYFALDWEKTGWKRDCYNKGLVLANSALDDMFIHAAVLELINMGNEGEPVDYIDLHEAATTPEDEAFVASSLRDLTNAYRSCLNAQDFGCVAGLEITDTPFSVAKEVEYLFKNVRTIIYQTRDEPRSKYVKSFRDFARGDIQLEKNRRKSGYMLNLTEDMLMFLTVSVIGAKESMSLVDLFAGFEKRGVFLDESSKDEIIRFYERRSMIDRKSDSGETQYVKRVL